MELEKSNGKRKRGRPPKDPGAYNETRETLLRAGMEILTEKGFVSSSIDEILKKVSIPKGSYYHYFESKEDFGRELLDRYISFFAGKLEKAVYDKTLTPLNRIRAFVNNASEGMARYEFKRGCLIGNMGQEMSVIPESFRDQLKAGFDLWQKLIVQILEEAQTVGEISATADCSGLAQVFWTGWEGAVMRARIDQSSAPLYQFTDFFISCVSI